VKGTGGADDVGILRLHFPEYSQEDENLEEISWDEFFDEFDRKGLALLVEDRMPNGQRSNFNKIISRETIEEFANRFSQSRGTQSTRSTTSRSRTQAASSSSKRGSTAKKQAANSGSRKKSASNVRTGSRRRAA
jgi:hypothetical protein